MKKLNKELIFKILILLLVFTVILQISNVVFKDNIKEFKNVLIDKYNFEQLEKVKIILDNIPKDAKKFYTLKDFNNEYKVDIKPKKNCYYVSNSNGKESYIFGFKLYSYKYINKYGTGYYIHPKYDLPVDMFCDGGPKCKDINYYFFIETISNPCAD